MDVAVVSWCTQSFLFRALKFPRRALKFPRWDWNLPPPVVGLPSTRESSPLGGPPPGSHSDRPIRAGAFVAHENNGFATRSRLIGQERVQPVGLLTS